MKKQIKIAVITAAVVLSLSACKKTYECHCDKVGDEHFDIKAKEADASSECKAKQTAAPTVYSKCELE